MPACFLIAFASAAEVNESKMEASECELTNDQMATLKDSQKHIPNSNISESLLFLLTSHFESEQREGTFGDKLGIAHGILQNFKAN